MDEIVKQPSTEIIAETPIDEEFTALCKEQNFEPAVELVNLIADVTDLIQSGDMEAKDGYRLKLDAIKAALPYRYGAKKAIGADFTAKNIFNVQVVQYGGGGAADLLAEFDKGR